MTENGGERIRLRFTECSAAIQPPDPSPQVFPSREGQTPPPALSHKVELRVFGYETDYSQPFGRGENNGNRIMDCGIRPGEVCFELHGPEILECGIAYFSSTIELLFSNALNNSSCKL